MPNHRNNWRVTVALFALTGIVESFAFGHLNAFTPLYLEQLNVAPDQIPRWTGMLAAFGFILGIPLLPFWGVWADRYSRKLIIVRSSYAGALLFALSALSATVWQLAAARMLSGLVLGNTGVMLAVQADITPRERLGLAIALVTAGSPLGMALGPLFGGYIVQRWGVGMLLMIDAALTAVVALLLTLVLHEEPRVRRTDVSMGALLRESLVNIVRTPLVLRLFALGFVVMLGLSLASPFVPIQIDQLYSGARSRVPLIIGAIVSSMGIAMAVSTPLWGRLSDRIGYVPVLRIGVLSVGLMFVVQSLASSLPLFIAGRIGQGLVQGGIDAAIVALIALRTPVERRAAVLNLSRLPLQLTWFLGPVLGALVSPWGLPAIFGASAALSFGGFGATLLLASRDPAAERAVPEQAGS
jgi:DHA1 family multidrug resistance protein-like MFS transporter